MVFIVHTVHIIVAVNQTTDVVFNFEDQETHVTDEKFSPISS
jgi:hypothetical protein